MTCELESIRGRRREVGRRLIAFNRALESSLRRFDEAKSGTHGCVQDATEACEAALREAALLTNALEALRDELKDAYAGEVERLSRGHCPAAEHASEASLGPAH